ncbi:hypothetical protein GCK72_025254 [Caenorhabditis remanei]|uniref:Uncharacterized protein n=1 Tax=Caenorhabditis remanei TaxID=31234 RepID=A0A6A5G1F2_CAERE|nr:hypothetical protein GCK72_025254 [Caenorhabditis remanei]KAF1748787.1 hypothetical protein GCK72_025254 [Caenorhabditis remanei]
MRFFPIAAILVLCFFGAVLGLMPISNSAEKLLSGNSDRKEFASGSETRSTPKIRGCQDDEDCRRFLLDINGPRCINWMCTPEPFEK